MPVPARQHTPEEPLAPRLSRLFIAPLALASLFAAAVVPGCASTLGIVGASGGSLSASSLTTGNTLSPRLTTIVYLTRGEGDADVYLTDLAEADLDPATPIDELTGSIIHLKLFLKPMAGSTPIEQTATTAAVRHLVLANGAIGLYGGGGFVFQRGEAGDRTVGGSLADATVRLVRSTPDFADQLGAAVLSGGFSARLDPERAEQLETLLTDAKSYAQEVQPVLIEELAAGR